MTTGTKIGDRREKIRKQHWAREDAWTGDDEKGWFKCPRTLPLILQLLREKAISGKKDPSLVYLELFSRHLGQGVIEMGYEANHAYAAGYVGRRAVRTWQERMQILEQTGFIKTAKIGNQQYKYVLLVHPTIVVQKLREAGKVSDEWWNAYVDRKMETKERTHEQREKKKKASTKVVSMIPTGIAARGKSKSKVS